LNRAVNAGYQEQVATQAEFANPVRIAGATRTRVGRAPLKEDPMVPSVEAREGLQMSF
jgi:hypothetical protein